MRPKEAIKTYHYAEKVMRLQKERHIKEISKIQINFCEKISEPLKP